MKIRRRLGVSPGPVGFERSVDGEARARPALLASSENRSSTPRACARRTIATPIVCGPAGIVSAHRRRSASRPTSCDALAVQRDLDRLVGTHRRQPEDAAAGAADAELVLGVERKHVLDEQAAARAERQPFAVRRLRDAARRRYVVSSGLVVGSPTARRLIFAAAET